MPFRACGDCWPVRVRPLSLLLSLLGKFQLSAYACSSISPFSALLSHRRSFWTGLWRCFTTRYYSTPTSTPSSAHEVHSLLTFTNSHTHLFFPFRHFSFHFLKINFFLSCLTTTRVPSLFWLLAFPPLLSVAPPREHDTLQEVDPCCGGAAYRRGGLYRSGYRVTG